MKHNGMIAWLAKFDIWFYCKQCTEVMRTINLKKNGIKAINNSSVLETKTSSQLQESMQAPFSWWPDTGFLQALKGGISLTTALQLHFYDSNDF